MPKIKTGTAAILMTCMAGTVWAQGLEFRLQRGPLDLPGRVVPVLEGQLRFDERRPDSLRGLPSGLSPVGYAEIPWSATVSVLGLRGQLPDGTRVIVLDRNGNHDMSDDRPVVFARQDGIDQARVEISYRHIVGERPVTGTTTLVLLERTPGKIDYHFDELWETAVQVGGETLRIALQRWPTLFLDVQFDRTYQKPFFPDKEILALGGRFFRVHIDWPSERIRLEETDRRPVDVGQLAPGFDAEIVGTGRRIRLAEQRGRVVVLTFWSPLCSGSQAEAARYHQLAESFAGDPRFRFVAVTQDAAALAGYLTGHRHAFDHVVSTDLWTAYGVTAPFVTFVIDGRTKIVRRTFGFDPDLPTRLTALAEDGRQAAQVTVRLERAVYRPGSVNLGLTNIFFRRSDAENGPFPPEWKDVESADLFHSPAVGPPKVYRYRTDRAEVRFAVQARPGGRPAEAVPLDFHPFNEGTTAADVSVQIKEDPSSEVLRRVLFQVVLAEKGGYVYSRQAEYLKGRALIGGRSYSVEIHHRAPHEFDFDIAKSTLLIDENGDGRYQLQTDIDAKGSILESEMFRLTDPFFLGTAGWRTSRLDPGGREWVLMPAADEPAVARGFRAPLFQFRDLSGRISDMNQLRGRPILIQFWSSSCEHSRRIREDMNALTRDSRNIRLAVLASAFKSGSADDIRTFLLKEPVEAAVVIADEESLRRYNPLGISPFFVLIDGEGVVRHVGAGANQVPVLRKKIGPLHDDPPLSS